MWVFQDWIRVWIGIGTVDGDVGVGEEFVGWGLGLS